MALKDAVKSVVENVHEMLFHLRKNYSPHTEEQAFIEDIPQDDRFSFEEMYQIYLKTFSKSIRQGGNISLNNKVLLGGWISTASKTFLDGIKICAEKIYQVDLKIGCLKNVK